MKFYISYFYNIRFLKPNQIPFSTAVWDPKWYHGFKSQDHKYIDKRGVLNGERIEVLNPSRIENSTECCDCKLRDTTKCGFLKHYKEYLNKLDFDSVLMGLVVKAQELLSEYDLGEDPEVILIVHESPNNPCSERWVLKEWFKEHGVILEEWSK